MGIYVGENIDNIFVGDSKIDKIFIGDDLIYEAFSVDSTLNNNSWTTINKVSARGLADNYWDIGDCKAITLNGTIGTLNLSNITLYVYILGFNHNSSIEGEGITFGCFKTALTNGIDIALTDGGYNGSRYTDKYFNMNHWGDSSNSNTNYGGWAACDVRYDILGSTDIQPSVYGSVKTTSVVGYNPSSTCASNPVSNTLMAALPLELRKVMKKITKYTDNKGNSSNSNTNVTITQDYLPLLSEFEVLGARSYANQYEYTDNKQLQYQYYRNGNSKIKYRHSSTSSVCHWLLRSAIYNGSSAFCYINSSGASVSTYAAAAMDRGLAPVFLV